MKIAVMGDLHYPVMKHADSSLLEARDTFFREIVRRFLAIDADLHIALGDLTNEGLPEEYERVYGWIRQDPHARRFVQLFGNHDKYTLDTADILSLTGQSRYSRIDTSDAVVVLLDTARDRLREDWSGFLDEAQLQWLTRFLMRPEEEARSEEGDRPLLLFAHHPLYDTTTRSTEEYMWLAPEIDLRGTLQRYAGTGFYFNGHNHANSIVRENRWHYVQTADVLDYPAFRLIEATREKVDIRLMRIEEEELWKLARRIGENMIEYHPYAPAPGERKDGDLLVRLNEILS